MRIGPFNLGQELTDEPVPPGIVDEQPHARTFGLPDRELLIDPGAMIETERAEVLVSESCVHQLANGGEIVGHPRLLESPQRSNTSARHTVGPGPQPEDSSEVLTLATIPGSR
jgi:hypothetical protein